MAVTTETRGQPSPQAVEVGRFFVLVRVLEHWFIPFSPWNENQQAVFVTRLEAQQAADKLKEIYGEKGYRTVSILVA